MTSPPPAWQISRFQRHAARGIVTKPILGEGGKKEAVAPLNNNPSDKVPGSAMQLLRSRYRRPLSR